MRRATRIIPSLCFSHREIRPWQRRAIYCLIMQQIGLHGMPHGPTLRNTTASFTCRGHGGASLVIKTYRIHAAGRRQCTAAQRHIFVTYLLLWDGISAATLKRKSRTAVKPDILATASPRRRHGIRHRINLATWQLQLQQPQQPVLLLTPGMRACRKKAAPFVSHTVSICQASAARRRGGTTFRLVALLKHS